MELQPVIFEDHYRRLCELDPARKKRYVADAVGNSLIFADFVRPMARFVPERKRWFVYDGRVWRPDECDLQVMDLLKELTMLLPVYASTVEDSVVRDSFLKRCERWHSRRTRELILKDAAGWLRTPLSDFDRDPMLFNCLNGTLDLSTRGFRPHQASDLLTRISGVDYLPGVRCERWEQFVREVMTVPQEAQQLGLTDGAPVPDKTAEKAAFFQKCLGYALTGDTRYEALFVLYGATTRNGKGTAMETFLRLMGDYGKTARPELIGTRPGGSSSGPSEDVARLNGARFVNISEPDKRLNLSVALVKSLTGNDTINARFLHENSFEFRPQFKLFINTNHLPQVNDLTLFSSDRVRIIPFERHFGQDERDLTLKRFFAYPICLSGILNWCIDGLVRLGEEGLDSPACIREATENYRRDSDKTCQFVEEMLAPAPGGELRTSAVYRAYQQWCEQNGYCAENMRHFKLALESHGTIVRKRPQGGGEKTSLLLGFAPSESWGRLGQVI